MILVGEAATVGDVRERQQAVTQCFRLINTASQGR
jgi:hypothetical protein